MRLLFTTLLGCSLVLLGGCSPGVTSDPGGHGGSTTGSGTTAGSGTTTGSGTTAGSGTTGSGTATAGCRADTDCEMYAGERCFTGNACIDSTAVCDGNNVLVVTCTVDADCATPGVGGYTCRQCGGGAGFCELACHLDSDCGPGATCDAHGHCLAATCSAAIACPANQVCGADGTCTRKTCSADSDCEGFCVTGHCAEALGYCNNCT